MKERSFTLKTIHAAEFEEAKAAFIERMESDLKLALKKTKTGNFGTKLKIFVYIQKCQRIMYVNTMKLFKCFSTQQQTLLKSILKLSELTLITNGLGLIRLKTF